MALLPRKVLLLRLAAKEYPTFLLTARVASNDRLHLGELRVLGMTLEEVEVEERCDHGHASPLQRLAHVGLLEEVEPTLYHY